MRMINEFVEEIKAKINHKKEYHKNFYEKLGQTLNDNDLHKATQLAFDDCMEIVNKLAEKYRNVPDTNVGKNLSENLIERLEEERNKQIKPNWGTTIVNAGIMTGLDIAIEIVNQLTEEYKDVPDINVGKWIPCEERLPECDNKYGWVSCIVSVIRSHYPTSSYDICDSPYDENIVMHADYHVSQKIWHLDCDEQLNALMDIEDSPLNGDYVVAWKPLPEPYKGE